MAHAERGRCLYMTIDVHPRTWTAAQAAMLAGNAVVVGGGTSLQPWLAATGAEPAVLVHLRRIDNALNVEVTGTGLRVGAMVPVSHPLLAPWFGAEGADWFATPAVRRRAT